MTFKVQDKSKSITFIIDSLAQGGSENVCVTLANGLANRGWDVCICTLTPNNILQNNLNKTIQVDCLDIKSLRTGWITVLKYIRRNKPQKIMCFFYQTAILLIFLKLLGLIKPLIIVRNNTTLSRKHAMHTDFYHKHFLRIGAKFMYPKADYIIAQSEGMKNDLYKHYNVPTQKIYQIYNPIKSNIENSLDKAENYNVPTHIDILCVGRLVKAKGHKDALKAISFLIKQGKNISLHLVGEGPERKNLVVLADSLNIKDNIHFHGALSNVKPYYEAARLSILSSYYEGFPNVLVESIYCKTPVVSYDCESGPREIITKENGILVPLGNIDLLAKAIDKALNTKWNKDAIYKSAEAFRSEEIIRQYEDVLIK